MTKQEYFLFKSRQALSPTKSQFQDISKEYYLKSLKRTINFIRQHKKATEQENYEKMAFIEVKLNQSGYYAICKKLHSKKHIELIQDFEAQIKVINYIEKEGFISPEFQNVGLTYKEISNICILLLNKGILKQRNCASIAYEFADPTHKINKE